MAIVEDRSFVYRGNFFRHTDFHAGNKVLTVMIDGDMGTAVTDVRNIDGESIVPGATTEIYAEARDVIQATATQIGRDICYRFCTTYPSMKQWAMDPEKGQGIFNWDIPGLDSPQQGYGFIAMKTFHPLA